MGQRVFFGAVLTCIECGGSPVENPDIGLCASCAATARKEARNAAKVKVITPIKKVSKKMAKNLVDYGVLSRIYKSQHPECEVRIHGVCDGMTTDVHHRAGRGNNLLDASTFIASCRSCHNYVHDKMSAEERRDKGLLLSKEGTV